MCRNYLKLKNQVFQVNYEYTITEVEQGNLLLNEKTRLPIAVAQKNFTRNYARTCHSFQGSRIDDAITIFDWRFWHVDRSWVYTAIARATGLKKVFFFEYSETRTQEREMWQYFKRKVSRYRLQGTPPPPTPRGSLLSKRSLLTLPF